MAKNPEDIHRLFAEAVTAGNLEALVALYEPDATVIERTGERTEGVDDIRRHLAHLLTMRPAMSIQGSRVHRKGEFALLSSHWIATAAAPDGRPVRMEFHGSELARQQRDGTWRLLLDNPWGAD
ncbi:MAG: SgcJ/EcaC family oxidoreductase [Thermomicrobia bacterium]|nr:SgcJ/EcaC family oxidoreductase [Thermomicrobia bacterium]